MAEQVRFRVTGPPRPTLGPSFPETQPPVAVTRRSYAMIRDSDIIVKERGERGALNRGTKLSTPETKYITALQPYTVHAVPVP